MFLSPCSGEGGAWGGKEKAEGGGFLVAMSLAMVQRAVRGAPRCRNCKSNLKTTRPKPARPPPHPVVLPLPPASPPPRGPCGLYRPA